MSDPKTSSLAKRLLDSHIKRQVISGIESETEHLFRITDEELAWAEEILANHLDNCSKLGIHPDLTEAVANALAFALRREKVYEPIPTTARLRNALVMMEEQDADHATRPSQQNEGSPTLQDLAVKTELMSEEALGDLDVRLAPPQMLTQKIKVRLKFIGNERPRISYDPDND